jgi:hypothetical protein
MMILEQYAKPVVSTTHLLHQVTRKCILWVWHPSHLIIMHPILTWSPWRPLDLITTRWPGSIRRKKLKQTMPAVRTSAMILADWRKQPLAPLAKHAPRFWLPESKRCSSIWQALSLRKTDWNPEISQFICRPLVSHQCSPVHIRFTVHIRRFGLSPLVSPRGFRRGFWDFSAGVSV